MIVYIAGKVTGLPIIEVTHKFGHAQKMLEDEGFEVINPLAVVSEKADGWSTPWHQAMRVCIAELMRADAVYVVGEIWDSKGALIECGTAIYVGILVTDSLKTLWELRLKKFEIPSEL